MPVGFSREILLEMNGSLRDRVASFKRRKKMLEPHPERADEIEEFKVSHPHKLALDFREGAPGDIKSLVRESLGQFCLRPTESASQLSNFWTNEILTEMCVHEWKL